MKKNRKSLSLVALALAGLLVTPYEAKAAQTVTVYVVDTGVRPDHAVLVGSVSQSGFTNVNDAVGTGDCNGHGTHVAGVIHSIAPSATIVPVRTFDCGAVAWTSNIVAGIDWAVTHHQANEPAVMNLSITGPLSNSLNSAVSRAIADGIVVVTAAGNNAKDACGYSPGSVSDTINVGAVELNATKWQYSNYGQCVDVFAPGVSITSAWYTSTTATKTLKGTSQAAPFVTGFVAGLLSANPTMTQSGVRSAVIDAATKPVVGDAGPGSPTAILDPTSLVVQQAPAPTTTAATTTLAPTTTTVAPATTTTTLAPMTTTTQAQKTATTVPTYTFAVPANVLRVSGKFLYRVWLTEPNGSKKVIIAEYLNGTTVTVARVIPPGASLSVTYLKVG